MTGALCADRLEVRALTTLPLVAPGDDLGALIVAALRRAEIEPAAGDVLVVTSKIVSRAEDRFVDLSAVEAGPAARRLADEIEGDPRVVQLVLEESVAVSRKARGVLIVRHRLGFVSANAGIDQSNAEPPGRRGGGPWALLLPRAPDDSARRLRAAVSAATGADVAVVISDSHGRPFRLGTVGVALGVAGLPALWDGRGHPDLFGRPLEHTVTALADQIAATADLVAGQGSEGRPVVHLRGLRFDVVDGSARDLVRPPADDLYA